MRFCAGKEQAATYTRRIKDNLPSSGKVNMLYFTDKQYENMQCFRGRKAEPGQKNPEQYLLL